jgi:hypothetical protein
MSNLSVCYVTAWQGVRRSYRTTAEVLAAVRQLRRGELGGSPAAQLREYNPLLHVAAQYVQYVQYVQRESRLKVPFPQFFSTLAEITPITSLCLLWKYQRCQTQSL